MGVTTGFDRRGVRQEFPWGSIDWLHSANGEGFGKTSLGMVTLGPGGRDPAHRHYDEEQVLYGMVGTCLQVVDGKVSTLTPGSWIHIPPRSTHEMSNPNLEPCSFLLVANPVLEPDLMRRAGSVTALEAKDSRLNDLVGRINLEGIQEKFASATGFGVTFTDALGVVLVQATNLPEFCRLCSVNRGPCEFLRRTIASGSEVGVEWLRCRYGLVALRVPVVVLNTVVFYVTCGYVLLEPPDSGSFAAARVLANLSGEDPEEFEDLLSSIRKVSKNRLLAAAELLRVTAYTLADMFLMTVRERELQQYRLNLLKEQRERAQVEAELQRAKFQIIESQVNPHFLFNTLNTIAQMAVLEGSISTSKMVYALSDLLRFSMRKVGSLVTLGEEIEYVKNYLYIQSQRFADSFTYEVCVDDQESLNLKVPALTVQPIVENAVIHGFLGNRNGGLILITIHSDGDKVVIRVEDNGLGMPTDRLAEVKRKLIDQVSQGSYTGLCAVQRRLLHHFGSTFEMEIESAEGTGTAVTLVLSRR